MYVCMHVSRCACMGAYACMYIHCVIAKMRLTPITPSTFHQATAVIFIMTKAIYLVEFALGNLHFL